MDGRESGWMSRLRTSDQSSTGRQKRGKKQAGGEFLEPWKKMVIRRESRRLIEEMGLDRNKEMFGF